MGKHVFVGKPLVHSLYECRTLQELAARKGVVTQMGNQGPAFEGASLVKEWYEAGLIGDVREVITWTDRPRSGWGFPGHPAGGHTKYADPQDMPPHPGNPQRPGDLHQRRPESLFWLQLLRPAYRSNPARDPGYSYRHGLEVGRKKHDGLWN